jgi:hypothetical protein
MAQSGFGNPFFYHQFSDDFDNALGASGLYTLTGTGSAAHTPGDGGLGLFSTTGSASTHATIQLPVASVSLPLTGNNPPVTANSSKKLFYLARMQLSDVTLTGFIAGLCATGAPFTTGVTNVTDGLYFYKAPGGTALQLINVASNAGSPSGASFTNTFVIPTTAYSLVAATNFDIGFYIDGNQNLFAYVGSQLVGWIPQSGTGGVNAAGTPSLPVLGPVLANYNYNSQGNQSPIMYTTTNLNLTLGVSNGVTAAIKTMTADFHCFQKER